MSTHEFTQKDIEDLVSGAVKSVSVEPVPGLFIVAHKPGKGAIRLTRYQEKVTLNSQVATVEGAGHQNAP